VRQYLVPNIEGKLKNPHKREGARHRRDGIKNDRLNAVTTRALSRNPQKGKNTCQVGESVIGEISGRTISSATNDDRCAALFGWMGVMSDNTAAVAELSPNSFEWMNPDWARLTEAIHRLLVPFVVPDLRFRGDVVLNGTAKVTRTYDTVEKWADALNADVKSADCYLSASSDRSVSLRANYSDGHVNLWIRVPEADLGGGQELLARLKADIGLRDEQEASAQSNTYLERVYRVEKHKDAAWCLSAVEFLVPAAKGQQRFDSRIEFGATAGLGQSFRNRDEWQKVVAADWGSLTQLQCSGYQGRGGVENRIVWNMQSSDLRVRMQRSTAREVYSDFEALEAKLGLQPTGGGFARNPLEGGKWTYFAPREADSSWFEKCVVPAILSAIGGDYYLDLTVRHGPLGRTMLYWQTIDKWRRYVAESWAGIVELRAYLSGPGLTLSFNYENFHERVTLEVRTPTKQVSDNLAAQFVSQLNLEPLADEQYWQVRTTAVYTIPLFSNEIFAAELQAVLRLLFPAKYMLYEARILEPLGEKAGENEKQTVVQYPSLDEFLARLGQDKAYTEAYLRLEGPRGKLLHVTLTGKPSKLEIRSSERPGDFSRILKQLEKRLALTVVSVTPSVPEKKTLKDSAWVLIALPVATAFATGTMFSDTFRGWITTKPKLEIISPPAGIVPPNIEVRWQLQTESFGSKHINEGSKASFRIIRDATELVQRSCAPPGEKVDLLPGKYTLVVNSCDYGETARLQFEVQAPSR
jgi:hypothetical protein